MLVSSQNMERVRRNMDLVSRRYIGSPDGTQIISEIPFHDMLMRRVWYIRYPGEKKRRIKGP